MSDDVSEAEALAAKGAMVKNLQAMRDAEAWLRNGTNFASLTDAQKGQAIETRGRLATLILEAENIRIDAIVSEGKTYTEDLDAAIGALKKAVGQIQTTTAILDAGTKLVGLAGRVIALV